jgi:transposase/ribosomal protein L34
MRYVQGENRDQLALIPLCLDDYVDAASICRVIAAYVASLDLEALEFKYAKPRDTGRPPYDPASMLMLYLYGYLNRIRSSRRLETETKRNLEVMWLLEKVTPDDKTISNFRRDNADALKKVFRQFSVWCNHQGLFGKELLAVDSTKIRANSSWRNIHTEKSTKTQLALIENKIEKYIQALEENDKLEVDEQKLSSQTIAEILKHLNDKKGTLLQLQEKIEANDGKEISTVDLDARIMSQGGDGRPLDACYSVQTSVDSKYKLIVDFEISQSSADRAALFKTTESAKEIMGAKSIDAVADKGYYDVSNIAKCQAAGTTCFVPISESGRTAPDRNFNHEKFIYESASDSYTCPQGANLTFKGFRKRKNSKAGEEVVDRLYENALACEKCTHQNQCTASKRGVRSICRVPNQDALDIHNNRMSTSEAREIVRKRKGIVEHPFGTTKRIWGYAQFLCRKVEHVTAEQSLAFLAYNFRRVYNIYREKEATLLCAFM